jgi:hypothetical protein
MPKSNKFAPSLHDSVTWTSQAGGFATTKVGIVIEIVPEGCAPTLYATTSSRGHASYVVAVPRPRGMRPKIYWPATSKLRSSRRRVVIPVLEILLAAMAGRGADWATRGVDRAIQMSSESNILPNATAVIASGPQGAAFRIERIAIFGTPGNWIVNDIRVSGRSQFTGGGDMPGEMLSHPDAESFLRFDTMRVGEDLEIEVTYVGAQMNGEPFICAAIGTSVAGGDPGDGDRGSDDKPRAPEPPRSPPRPDAEVAVVEVADPEDGAP